MKATAVAVREVAAREAATWAVVARAAVVRAAVVRAVVVRAAVVRAAVVRRTMHCTGAVATQQLQSWAAGASDGNDWKDWLTDCMIACCWAEMAAIKYS